MGRKRVAVFMENYALGRCSVALCILDMLSSEYDVHLFIHRVYVGGAPIFLRKSIRIIESGKQGFRWWCIEFARAVRHPSRFMTLYGKFRSVFPLLQPAYSIYITFDPHGFVRCMSLFPKAKPMYVSLELYFRDNYYDLSYPESVMLAERQQINQIAGLIIQSPDRERLFREEYALDGKIQTFFLPVTNDGAPHKSKSNYLYQQFGIQKGTKLLLHLGGIKPNHSCLEIVEAFANVPDWMLVFHGHSTDKEYLQSVKTKVKELRLANVLFTDEVRNDITEIDEIVASCRAGLCIYADLSPNLATAGQSSGKTTAYLRFGLPVVINNPQYSRMPIEDSGSGVCIEALSDLATALDAIDSDYDHYSANALKEYERTYWFENYRQTLGRFLGANE